MFLINSERCENKSSKFNNNVQQITLQIWDYAVKF